MKVTELQLQSKFQNSILSLKIPYVKGPQFISFVRETEATRGKQLKSAAGGILATCNDWQMRADVNRQLAFPQHIAITNLRPDIVLWSQTKKTVVLIELTVPYEEQDCMPLGTGIITCLMFFL